MSAPASAEESHEELEPEWVSWSHARWHVAAAGLCQGDYPDILGEWISNGLLDTRSQDFFINGERHEQDVIPVEMWRSAKKHGLVRLYSGDLKFKADLGNNGGLMSVIGRNIQVRRSQLEALAPLDEEALQHMVSPSVGNDPQRAVAGVDRKGVGGAPKRQDAWDAFWMAVVDLAVDERLTASHFSTQKELTDELLEMIGEALTERTIKAKVSQVYKRWVRP